MNRTQILQARQRGDITAAQATALLNALSSLQRSDPNATLSQDEVQSVLGGGQVDRRNIFQRLFGGITTEDPQDPRRGLLTRGDFNIPFTDVAVNLPLLAGGATLASLGIGGPGAATAVGASRAGTIGAARTAAPVIARRAGRAALAGAATGITGGIVGAAQAPTPPITDFGAPPAPEPVTGAGAEAAREIAGARPQPTPDRPPGPIIQNDILDDEGNPTGNVFFTRDGQLVSPDDLELQPDESQQQANFLGTREGQEFLAQQRRQEAEIERQFQREQAVLGTQLRLQEQRVAQFEAAQEAKRQREFAAAESKAARDAAFVQALLPILASPGSRFRFAANVSRMGGGQAQFTPTEAFGRLFRFSGFQPGQAVPLTGQQEFSIIPNIQQFAELDPRSQEELGAIVDESAGRSLFDIGRQSRRLAPPR